MRAALLIAFKDIRQRFRDRSVFIWGIIAPVGLAAVFSLLLGQVAGGDFVRVSFGVVDLDGGGVSALFVDDVLGALEQEDIVTEIVHLDTIAAAEDLVSEGTVVAVFVRPSGFSAAAGGGAEAAIEVFGYVGSPIGTQVARSIADQFAGEINGVGMAIATVATLQGEVPDEGTAAALVGEVMQLEAPLSMGSVEASDKELDASTFYSAGMAIMFLFLTVQFGVLGLLEEKTNGTMGRLLSAPISRWSIVFGKGLTSFAIGLVSMGAVIVITTLALGADWGDPLGVATLVLAGVLAAMGVMTLIAAFAHTAEQAQNLQAIVALSLAMLGGSFFPVAQAGGLLAKLSLLTPHAWFLRGLGDLAGGADATGIIGSLWPILLFAAVTMGLASFRLGKVVSA